MRKKVLYIILTAFVTAQSIVMPLAAEELMSGESIESEEAEKDENVLEEEFQIEEAEEEREQLDEEISVLDHSMTEESLGENAEDNEETIWAGKTIEAEAEEILDDGFSFDQLEEVGATSGKYSDNAKWSLTNGVLTISGTGIISYGGDYPKEDDIKEIIIESGITAIEGSWFFSGCKNLKKVTIPGTIKEIPLLTFSQCFSLETAIISDGVEVIGEGAFSGCGNLKNVTIPESCTKIEDRAFSGCANLKKISIPAKLTSIGDSAFGFCSSLEEIKVSANNPSFVLKDGVLFNKKMTQLILYPAQKKEKTYSVPKGVTELGTAAFSYGIYLTDITLPTGLNTIGGFSFYCCEKLKSMVIPNTVKAVGEQTFAGCVKLEEASIPNSITKLEFALFGDCRRLTSITIPESITEVSQFVFEGSGVETIYFKGSAPVFIGEDDGGWYGNNDFAKDVTATVYYPSDKAGWVKDKLRDYGGKLTWIPYNSSTPDSAVIIGLYNSSKGGDLRWKAVRGADKYVIYRTNAGKTSKIATVSGSATSYMDESIKNNSWGKVYVYYVCSQKGTSISARSNGQTLQRLAPMKITSAVNGGNSSVVLKWAVSSGSNKANGYELQYAKSTADLYGQRGTFRKVSISGRNNLSRTISGLTKGQTYYYRVRAYVNYTHSVTGVRTKTWSQYSNVVSVKIMK